MDATGWQKLARELVLVQKTDYTQVQGTVTPHAESPMKLRGLVN